MGELVDPPLSTRLELIVSSPKWDKCIKGAMGEFSNFYNYSRRLFIFGTYIPPIITIYVSLISLIYFLNNDFLFLGIRTYIQNLSPRTNFKYMT